MNLLSNTQVRINSALSLVKKQTIAGTGDMPALSVSSYTTGSNVITALTSNTGDVKVGDLVLFDASAHAYLRLSAVRIDSLVTNTSFTFRLPFGATAPTSAACTAQPVTVGDLSGVTGNGPDGVSKTPGLLCWIDDHSANCGVGASRVLAVRKTSNSAQYVWRRIPTERLAHFCGRDTAFGLSAYHKVKGGSGTWRPIINTNSGATYGSSATQSYQDIGVTATTPNSPVFLDYGIELNGNSGDVYYLRDDRANPGTTLEAYWPQMNERIIPTVTISFAPWVNANYTFNTMDAAGNYSFSFCPYAESNGCISPDVRLINVTWEGRNSSTSGIGGTYGQALGFKSQECAPIVFGFANYSKVANAQECIPFQATIGSDGKAYFYSEQQGVNIYNSSMEANGYTLA